MKKKKRLLSFISAAALVVALIVGSCLPAFAEDLNYPYQPGIYHYTDKTRYDISNIQYLSDSSVALNGKTYSARQFRFTFSDLSIWTGDEICVVLPYTFKAGEIDTSVKSSIRISFAVAGWSWEIMDSVFLSPWDFASSNSVYRRLPSGYWTNGAASSIFSVDRVENCYNNNTSITFYSDDLYATGDMLFILMLRRKANSPATDLTIYDYDLFFENADKASPEYPNYFRPDDSAFIQNENTETQLKGETAAGLDDLGSTFTGFTDLITGFIPAMLFVSNVMGSFINKIPLFGLLIRISLALGMFAFLLGIGQHLVGVYRSRGDASHRRRRGDK